MAERMTDFQFDLWQDVVEAARGSNGVEVAAESEREYWREKVLDLTQQLARTETTLTREREEAIERADAEKGTADNFKKLFRDESQAAAHWKDRAHRAEAQLAEAQRALEIDRHALSAMQRDLDQSRGEVERLRAALKAEQTVADHIKSCDCCDFDDWPCKTGEDLIKHAETLRDAALNPPAEGQDS